MVQEAKQSTNYQDSDANGYLYFFREKKPKWPQSKYELSGDYFPSSGSESRPFTGMGVLSASRPFTGKDQWAICQVRVGGAGAGGVSSYVV